MRRFTLFAALVAVALAFAQPVEAGWCKKPAPAVGGGSGGAKLKTPGGSTNRPTTSVLNQPEFRVQWRDAMRVSEDVVSGMTEAEAKDTMLAERPMMVYIYDGEAEEDLRFEIEECKAFFDDKVAIGARFFDCIRIDALSAKEDRALAKSFRRLPALVFLRPNYDVAAKISGKFATAKVFSSMCTTMKKDYANCVSTVVKKQQRIMKQRVELQREWGKVDELDERIADERSESRRAKLIRERESLVGKLEQEQGELTANESKLYELENKPAKSA